jgi:hypothetical protein
VHRCKNSRVDTFVAQDTAQAGEAGFIFRIAKRQTRFGSIVKSVKIWALDLGHVDTSLKNKSRRSGSILRKWNMPPASDAIAECLTTLIAFLVFFHHICDPLLRELRPRDEKLGGGQGAGKSADVMDQDKTLGNAGGSKFALK